MPRGLPRSYIKKASRELGKGASWSSVFKRAWQLYKGSKVHQAIKSSRKSNPKKTKRRRGGLKMTRRKRRRSRSLTIPLAPIAGLIAGIAEPINYAIQGDYNSAMEVVVRNYTGYSMQHKSFNPVEYLPRGLLPLIGGLLVHKFVGGSPLNLNRILARNKVPLIRI